MTVTVKPNARITIDLTQGEAANIARQVVENSDDQATVVDIAVLAMDNLLQSPAGKELLHSTLKAHGMELSHIPGWVADVNLQQSTPTRTARASSNMPRLKRINKLITAFELSEATLAQLGCDGIKRADVIQGNWQRFVVPDELDALCRAIEEHVLQPQHFVDGTSRTQMMVDLALLETHFNVTSSMYAEAGLTAASMVGVHNRDVQAFDEEALHEIREQVRAYLLKNL